MQWKIGDVVIDNQVCLAPMAGITDSAFRSIVKELGCGLIYTEMISDKAIMYNNKKTLALLYFTDQERPIVVQIFGNDLESFTYAAKYVYEKVKPDIIDINLGCPVPKVAVRSQAGAALLKNPNRIYELVKAVVESVPCPVTVKMRSGWDAKTINAVEVAKLCEKAGAKAICIHPRTRSQGYSGKADWNIIKAIKESVTIPVIGNGDIKSAEDAKRMLDMTGCDAIMVGRGVLGNPWLIQKIVTYLETGNIIAKPILEEKIQMCLEHLKRLIKLKNEKTALLEIRSHAAWYVKGLPGATELRKNIFNTKDVNSLIELLNNYINSYKNIIE
ncbi:MAG: tRNA dihydrouridine synthase DusB [Bacilli bacterium]